MRTRGIEVTGIEDADQMTAALAVAFQAAGMSESKAYEEATAVRDRYRAAFSEEARPALSEIDRAAIARCRANLANFAALRPSQRVYGARVASFCGIFQVNIEELLALAERLGAAEPAGEESAGEGLFRLAH